MKRLASAAGFVLLTIWFCALPASACDKCVYQGPQCLGSFCWDKYSCQPAGTPCSQCFDDCREEDGAYCHLELPCQFAEISTEGKLQISAARSAGVPAS